jgi:ABC-type phosphate/phosphonate transport system permease subunit
MVFYHTQQARQKQESAKEEFEMISEILRKELDRFEKTKGKEMSKSLKDYAKENMDTTVQVPFAFALAFVFAFVFAFVISLPLSASSWFHLRSSFLPCAREDLGPVEEAAQPTADRQHLSLGAISTSARV